MKKVYCLAGLLLLAQTLVFGNIARPQPTPNGKATAAIHTEMDIRLDRNAKEARLIIPKC